MKSTSFAKVHLSSVLCEIDKKITDHTRQRSSKEGKIAPLFGMFQHQIVLHVLHDEAGYGTGEFVDPRDLRELQNVDKAFDNV